MSVFQSELSGSLLFRSGSATQASLVPASDTLKLTGSLHITGSSLLFNGSDLINRIENIEAGSGDAASLGPLNRHTESINSYTASNNLDSASFDSRIDLLETTSSNQESSINTLIAATGSYLSTANDVINLGFARTASSNLVSSSAQIEALGFVTTSGEVPDGTISSSAQIADLGYISGAADGTISGSSQISALGYAVTSSNQFTGSQFFSGSLIPEALSSENGIYDLGSQTHPWRDLFITTGSLKFVKDGEIVSTVSGEADAIRVGNILITTSSIEVVSGSGDSLTNVQTVVTATVSSSGEVETVEQVSAPDGTISGSAQITTLGFISQSNSIVDLSGVKIQYSNVYSNIGDLPAASDYHGMFAHFHATGKAYYAHGGNWIELANSGSSIGVNNITNFDTEVSASAASSGFGSGGGGGGVSSFDDLTDVPSGLVSSSQQIEDLGFDTGSSAYDGNRIVSNEDLGDLFDNSFNPGTSGSIQDFLDAVFYPNSGPSFTSTGSFFLNEFIANGSSVGTLTATDPESQALTFATQSGYTDDYVSVASNGAMTLNRIPTTEDFNTDDIGDGRLGHPVLVQVTDTFNASATSTIYVVINANQPPVFRQTSIAGNIITTFTANRNENAGATEVGKIYFTDPDSDTITIASSSIPDDHFTITKYGTYVQIDQATGSLDYEDRTSYEFSITASDEHYEAGDDLEASASLLITINVTDNVIPVVNDQTLGSINENSSNGATIGTIAASDAEGDTITFQNFTLDSLELDGGAVSTGTYGGTSQLTDPHEDPFQMNSTGTVTRKSGVFLNSDLVNTYKYSVQVVDQFNTASDSGIITININDDTPATISDNWSAGPYIIESALANDQIRINSNGRTGTQARLTANQSGAWTSSNAAINISQTGYLTVANNISGSLTGSGDTIASTITFRNTFKTITTEDITVQVAANDAPDASFTDLTANLNTNLATASANIVEGTITDDESDTPYLVTLSGTNASDLQVVYLNANSSSFNIQAISALSAGDYFYTASVFDNFDKSTVYNRSFTINQAELGTLTTNGTFYVIESAVSGDNIVLNSNGRTGTQGDIGVSYSPNYGSQAVSSFTSANSMLSVASNGNLTLGANLSGSLTQSGDTFTSEITWDDQYGNTGSGSVTINVTENAAPDIIFTNTSANLNTNLGRSGSTLTTITFSDTEGDTILVDEFTGTEDHGLNFKRSGNSYLVQPTGSLEAGSYTISGSIVDEHGFRTNQEAHDFTIAQADIGTMSTNGTFYVIESAETNDPVVTNSNGRTGTTGSLSVSYSPSYGSPAVASFTSSNDSIDVDDSTGEITLLVNISGSTTGSGDTITSDITFRDQYDNVGSGSITINVTANQPPTVVTFTDIVANLTASVSSGTGLVSMSISDTENNTPFSASLSGTDASKLRIDYLNAASSSAVIKADETLSAGTLNYNVRVTDNFDKFTDYTGRTIEISNPPLFWYAYLDEGGVYATSEANALSMYGDASDDGDIEAGTIFAAFKSGSFGTGDITTTKYSSLSVTKAYEVASGSTLEQSTSTALLNDINHNTGSQSNTGLIIVFPSGSDGFTAPVTMGNAVGGSTAGEYLLYADRVGTGIVDSVQTAYVRYFDMQSGEYYPDSTSINRFGVIFTQGDASTDIEYFFMASSGSAPSSTQ